MVSSNGKNGNGIFIYPMHNIHVSTYVASSDRVTAWTGCDGTMVLMVVTMLLGCDALMVMAATML